MLELPEILATETNGDGVLLTLRVPAELSYFPGHFPAHPVLPGVVQLRWVEELARRFNLIDGEFLRVERLKFMRIISQNYQLELELTKTNANTIQFLIRSEHGLHASGRIVFQ